MSKSGRTSVVRAMGLAAAGVLLGTVGSATSATSAFAAAPAAAPDAGPQVLVCGLDATTLGRPPLTLRFTKLHKVYYAGGNWSKFRLTLRNRTAASCPGVRPVVVYAARSGALRKGDVRLQWRAGRGAGSWHRARTVDEAGVLVGLVGPDRGLTLPGRSGAKLPLRMRFPSGAPLGEWLTMAIGFEPVSLDGERIPLPVGISDPHTFQLRRLGSGHGHGGRAPGGPELAATGGSAATGWAAGAAVAALGGGAGLVGYSRRRRHG